MPESDLYRRIAKGLRFVPGEKARTSIMRGLYDEIGHWTFTTTYIFISDSFWWPKVEVDVAHFVRSCDSCLKANTPEQNGPYGKMPVSGLVLTWSIDFAGPLKQTASGSKKFFWL